jgi:hypothetical protein
MSAPGRGKSMKRAREISCCMTSHYLLFDISVSRETSLDLLRSEIAGGLYAKIALGALIAEGALGEMECNEKRFLDPSVVMTRFTGLLP